MSAEQNKPNSAHQTKPGSAEPAATRKSHDDAQIDARSAIQTRTSLVVGIGVSAESLQAVEEFLTALEKRREAVKKMSIVFLQQLNSGREDLLTPLIKKTTSVKVVAFKKSAKLKPNAIYIAPPRAVLELKNGSLKVVGGKSVATATVTDDFFHSLAKDQTSNAVGIILADSASDGMLGLKDINDTGGLTFAQTVDSDKQDDMAANAAITGVADHVLSPAKIAEELSTYADYLEMAASATRSRLVDDIESAIPAIAKTLVSATNHNFKHYKTGTLKRRIQRRMQVLKISDAESYVKRLQDDETERQALFHELLISVTAFFRDDEAFDLLAAEVIPKIFADRKANDHVRIWVSGCATGEEAYSLAILCREQMLRMDKPPEVQIFATDIDQRALAVGREGQYPLGIQDSVSPERLKRFFKKTNNLYAVTEEIRELVLFSVHNLISDPPISNLDLISCRNLLIYLGPHLQKKLVPLFHFAIRPHGFLLLGPSENITSHADLFQTIDARWRICQRMGTGVDDAEALSLVDNSRPSEAIVGSAPPIVTRDGGDQDLLEVMQRIVLDEFSPKSVVVDEEGQILCASADMQKYLTVGTGNFENNIIKMARDGLRIGLRTTLQEAKNERRRIVHDGLSVKVGEDLQRVMITVQPMPRVGEDAELFMVIFHDCGLPLTRNQLESNPAPGSGLGDVQKSAGVGNPSETLLEHLERELATTRENLERSVHDVEIANEELKASNQELMSVNGELQTANEELTTSKQEVEANARVYKQAKNDLENLLQSTQIATIFLDDQLNIRSFTPAATEIYGLIDSDLGRQLTQLMPLADNIPPIPSLGELDRKKTRQIDPRSAERTSFISEASIQETFKTRSGKWFSRRVLPYINQRGESDGIVMTFVDVTKERYAQRDASQRERQLRTLTDNTPAQIAYIGSNHRYEFANESYAKGFDKAVEELIGSTVLSVVGEAIFVDIEEHLEAALTGERQVFEMEMVLDHLPEPLTHEVTYVPDYDDDGSVVGCYVLRVNITERKQWEQILQGRETYLRQVIDNIIGFVGILEVDGTLTDVNKTALAAGGISRDDVIGKPFWECYWWTHDEQQAERLKQAVKAAAAGEIVRQDMEARMSEDTRLMTDFMIAPVVDKSGKVIYLIPSGIDIEERVEAQEKAIRRQQQLSLATEVGRLGSWTWDTATNSISWSDKLHELYGYDREQFDGTLEGFRDIVLPEDRHIVKTAMDRVLNDEADAIEYECRSYRSDGQIIWTQIRGVIDRNNRNEAIRATGVAVDVTLRKQRELSLKFLANLQVELTDLDTEEEIVSVATSRTTEFLDLSHCILLAVDADAETADVFHDHHVEGAQDLCGLYDMSNFWSDEDRLALVSGQPLVINDTLDPTHPHKFRNSFESLGIRAIINAPSVRNQNMTYVLAALKSTPHQWQSHEIELLLELATSVYLRIERARAETELLASKRQLQLALEVADFAIGHVDYVKDEVTLSAEAAVLYGLGEASVVLTRAEIHSTFHPDDQGLLEKCIQDSLNPFGDGRISVEHRVLCPDGRTNWLNVRKQVFFDNSADPPTPSHAILVAQDISQRKETELAVSLNEARMRMAAETAGFGMLHVDLSDRTVVYSDELRKLVGITGVVGERSKLDRLPDWIHPDDHELCRSYYLDLFMTPEHSDNNIDHRIIRTDGEVRWVRLRSKPIYSGEGSARRPTQLIGTMLDITNQHQFERSLEEARALAELANESKSEFLANMSHEIRTPMSAILGYADILNRHLKDPDNRNCVSIIRSNGQFLLGIINDILDISKIEAGKLELSRNDFRVDQLVADVQSLMSVRAAEKQIDFTIEYREKIPQTIHSDDKRLKQVLVNLVGNAIKFTEKGGVKLVIGMERNSETPQLIFDIIDSGIGMSPDQTEKLFQPFTQADASVNRKFGGTGLGLSISQRLARMLNGDIEFVSELGKGSTFTLTIEVGDLAGVKLIEPKLSTPLVDTQSLPNGELPRPKLSGRYLVVDDRREIRFIAQHFVEDAGGEVVTAENGQQAIDIINAGSEHETSFKAIVLDMQMPVLDGYEAAQRMRAMGVKQPIIALTAHAMEGDRDACINAGCTDYIAKPLDGQKFIELLAKYANTARQLPNRRKILVVDDGEQSCHAVATLLRMEGHDVESAFDGKSAIESAIQFKPDVVLLDLGLPDMTGFEVLELLRQNQQLANTMFIALTGRDNDAEIKAARFDHHLLKPLDLTVLIKILS